LFSIPGARGNMAVELSELVAIIKETHASRDRMYTLMDTALREELAGNPTSDYQNVIQHITFQFKDSKENVNIVLLELQHSDPNGAPTLGSRDKVSQADIQAIVSSIQSIEKLEDERLVAIISIHALKRTYAHIHAQGNGRDEMDTALESTELRMSKTQLDQKLADLNKKVDALLNDIRLELESIFETAFAAAE